MGWLLGLFVAAIAGWLIAIYNRLVALDKRAAGAWADIDAQLKRRHDLVPALVETVKGYAAHERQTLEEVVARRGEAMTSPGGDAPSGDMAGRENMLAGALRGLFALAEDYPQLRASERFGKLQEQLSEIEDHLQSARRYYNAVVRDSNTAQQRFPDLVVARTLGFRARDFFQLDNPLERNAVKVSLDV